MQGQRSAIGSLPETLGFDHGSTSGDSGVDQRLCWNNMQNSSHHMLPEFVSSTSDPGSTYVNSMRQEGQSLTGWNLGEPSSHGTQNPAIHNERKNEHGWPSSMVTFGGPGPVSEGGQYEPANTFSLNNVNVNPTSTQISNAPLFVQSSSNAIPQELNMNAGFVGHDDDDDDDEDDDCQIVDCSNSYKSSASENAGISSASSSSDPFGFPSGSGGYLVAENDGRPGSSLEGRRLSCKRKALEVNTGQSSRPGSSSCFQPADSNVWHAVPGRYNAGSSLSIATPSENTIRVSPSQHVSARLGIGAGGATSERPFTLNMARSAESLQRNHRMRTNPSHQQDSVPINVFSTGSTVGNSNVSSQHQSSRLLPLNNSLDMRSSSTADNISPQRQSLLVHVPALCRTPQSSRWTRGSSSRAGHSSSSGDRGAILHEESDPISMPQNISEHPFVPANEMRNSVPNSTNWSLMGGNISIAGNIASTSRTGSGVGTNWAPHRTPRQYPRRFSEFVRRSLLSSAVSESGGQSSSDPPIHAGPSSQQMALSSGAFNPAHHPPHSRAALLLERQLDGAFGIPYPLRTLAAGSEGRSRLVSEIRSVLDLMRRGEGLRIEDVMILDQSVFFGMADVQDRHRDMRLDVDNMSYEELLALEERIGNVCTGLSEETILNRLKQRKYFSITLGAQLEVEPCCVCQEEYKDGEDLGILECGHEFHKGCIKQWLMHKNLCPICKTTGLSK